MTDKTAKRILKKYHTAYSKHRLGIKNMAASTLRLYKLAGQIVARAEFSKI